MHSKNFEATGIGRKLLTSGLARLCEIAVVLAVGLAIVLGATAACGEDPIASIGAVWVANLMMLTLVYCGLRLRGQGWSHFGLDMRLGSWRFGLRVFVQSLAVFAAATGAFVLGAILMANLVGMPERADMSQYDYLRGNLTMTILALLSVYFVSAFAEEIIYRGFMITRLAEVAPESAATRCLAVIVSSLVFGLVHSDWGIAGMVQASFMGLALGVSYLTVQRNLWVIILAHGYMDTILILQMYVAAP